MSYEIGQEVIVYDRFRFAIPLRAVVEEFALQNDGVAVRLLESNNPHYPVNCTGVWVSAKQLEPAESAPELGFDREQALSDSVEGIIDYQMREEGALRDTIDGLRQQLAAERERADSMTRHRDEAESVSWELKARAKKAEADLHLAQLEIAARKQECQTVTRKRDAAERELHANDIVLARAAAEWNSDMYKCAEGERLAWKARAEKAEAQLAESARLRDIDVKAKAKDEIESLRAQLAAEREHPE